MEVLLPGLEIRPCKALLESIKLLVLAELILPVSVYSAAFYELEDKLL